MNKILTSPCTESLSLRDFWHFACGAGSDARRVQGYLTGDVGTEEPSRFAPKYALGCLFSCGRVLA